MIYLQASAWLVGVGLTCGIVLQSTRGRLDGPRLLKRTAAHLIALAEAWEIWRAARDYALAVWRQRLGL